MKLSQIVSSILNGVIARVRREILAIAVAAVCAIGAIYELAAACVLALEPHLGGPGARLVVAGGFFIIGATAVAAPRLYDRNRKSVIDQIQTQVTGSRQKQLTAIVEAMTLGFSLVGKPRPKKK